LDPLYKGQYPKDMRALYEARVGKLDFIQPGDEKILQTPMDFLGVNYYERQVISANPKAELGFSVWREPQSKRTQMNWELAPREMSDLLQHLTEKYGRMPIYVSENGAAFVDPPVQDGRVHDQDRTEYIRDHLRASLDAIDHGVNLKGYFAWSLMDNFEWAQGYEPRFGLVSVDYKTQKRTPKDSALYFRQAIDENAP
jgi:beta-glucosidase